MTRTDLALHSSMDRSCVVRSQTGYGNLLSFARLFGLEAAVAGSDDYWPYQANICGRAPRRSGHVAAFGARAAAGSPPMARRHAEAVPPSGPGSAEASLTSLSLGDKSPAIGP